MRERIERYLRRVLRRILELPAEPAPQPAPSGLVEPPEPVQPPEPAPWPYQDIGMYVTCAHEVVHYPGDPPVWVRIGHYSGLAVGCQLIVGAMHRQDWVSTFPFRGALGLPGAFTDGNPTSHGDIVIGSDCWICRDSVILSGVTIGHGAIVGIRSVVTRDVRPFAVVVGSPAREVRRRYPDDICDRLLAIAWWNWPHEEVLKAVPWLNGGTIEEFLAYAEQRGA